MLYSSTFLLYRPYRVVSLISLEMEKIVGGKIERGRKRDVFSTVFGKCVALCSNGNCIISFGSILRMNLADHVERITILVKTEYVNACNTTVERSNQIKRTTVLIQRKYAIPHEKKLHLPFLSV